MTVIDVSAAPPAATRPLALVATRRLAILDELRVPYRHAEPAAGGRRWASLSGDDPGRALYWFVGGDGETARGWTVRSLPIWGHVASDAVVERLARSLPERFTRSSPVVDGSGTTRSWVWRSANGATILPFDPDEAVESLRSERYLEPAAPRRTSPTATARRAYYGIRPLVPRPAQIWARRAFSTVQARRTFPRWPWEPALHDLVDTVLRCVAAVAGQPVPSIAPWPRGTDWALVLTHDVETAAGRDAIEPLRRLEAARGYRSSWNLVPERYRVDDALVHRLRSAGCEIGVHGLRHDGRDLESWPTLERRLPEMRRWARRWDAVGFRAPATQRVWQWMPELGFDYDSSYPDTDPYEPIAGGCCSWLPFFNQQVVELPITLAQDHTLFVILRRGESAWQVKADLLRSRGGMALALTHPDYMGTGPRLAAYRRLLDAFADDQAAWKALPREVSEWWRRRAETSLWPDRRGWRAVGPAAGEAAILFTSPGPASRSPVPADGALW